MKRTFTFLLTALFLCVGMVKAAVTDVPEMSTEAGIKWYTIKNVRTQKYATYAGETASMTQQAVVQDGSLFYFTGSVADGVATVKIHNAQAGELLCAGTNSWTAEGIDWYIAAKADNGLSISMTADFSGTKSWNDFQGSGKTIDYWTATDAGSIWAVELFGADIQVALDKMLARKDNPIFGEPMYSEEAYNALAAAYETFNANATVENYNACKDVIAGIEVYMPQVGQYYHIECPIFYNTQGVHKALCADAELGWKTLNKADVASYWTPVETENGLAWKNAKNGKYLLGNPNTSGAWTTAETAEGAEFTLVVLKDGETQDDYQYAISVSGRHMHANNHGGGNGTGSNVVSWETNAANSASAWTITVAKDPSTLVEATVTYSFTYEGEEKYTQTTTTLLGEEWPDITVAFPYGVSASKPEGVVEAEKAAPTTFYVKNALSGQYLSYDVASNLTAADGEAVATIVPSSVVAGAFAVSYPGPNGAADPRYVQCGSKGRFSGNKDLTENSSVYLYKVTGEGAATRVNAVEDGASYVFVAKCSKSGYEGYWMITNELTGEGADLRMIGVKASDELADEITFEVGDYSPVWTVSAVKEEPAAVAFTKVIELEVAELPFVAAETAEGISKWYYATMHTNRPHYIKENAAGGIDWILETVGEAKSDSLLWGFVGNHFDGIKLINKGTGHAVVSTGGAAQMGDVASATTFILSGSSTGVAGGFCLKYPEGGQYLNASGTSVSSWGDPDAGSTFQLYTLPKEELTAFAAKFNELESLTEAYTSMYAISAVQNQFFAVYEAVAPVKEAIENGTATSEEVVAATASMTEVIAFVLAMDAKYNEWKAELMACYEVQDTTVTENVAAVAAFAAVVDKHSMYQWMMPAESVEDFDALIAELVAARESFIAAANTPMTPEMEAFLAKYGELEMVTETCSSLWFISVLNEKLYELIDAGDALKAKLLTATAEELSAFGVLVDEFIAFAQSMDAKYNEWKAELMACNEVQDTTTTASEEAVAAFAEVLEKHSSYQWSMPATSVEEIDALIAELVAARKAFIDDATGINNINVNVEAVIYDIHGRRVSTMEKGIYIVNGRKVIVK